MYKHIIKALFFATVCFAVLVGGKYISTALAQTTPYAIPSSRTVPWVAGDDIWNGGVLPTYSQVTCTGLAANGTTNDGPAIQNCINNAAQKTAVYLPAGTYYVNNTITLKSYVALRGAGSGKTIINLGSNGQLTTQDFSTDSGDLNPAVTYGGANAGYALSGAPQKGDTQLTISTGPVAVGDWIQVFSNDDPSLVTATGDDGFCEWCGSNNGKQLIQQMVQVTAKNGNTITISKPLYYTLYTNPQYRIITFPTQYAGYENFTVNGQGDIGASSMILLQGSLFSWVTGVESYDTGSNSGSAHIEMDYSYGAEIDNNYVHYGRSSASGDNYGIYFQFANSDSKVQNNISINNRHGILFQGPISGSVVLYNYVDDMYTDDLTYLGSARTSHGANPYMNLLEGNVISHLVADNISGSSNYITLFRNHFWGDETGVGPNVPPQKPNWGFIPLEIEKNGYYYNIVGNTLGITGKWENPQWSTYPVVNTNCSDGEGTNAMMQFGCDSNDNAYDTQSYSTALIQGNYDLSTNGVATWSSTNHTLPASLYYASEPSWWCTQTPWPSIGPDVPGGYNDNIPAVIRYNGGTCTPYGGPAAAIVAAGTGGGSGGTTTPPPAVSAPVITSSLSSSATVGSAFSYQIAGSNSPASYNATGLPPGLSVNTVSGSIVGTPTTAGTYSVTLSASNNGGTGTATLSIKVVTAVATAPSVPTNLIAGVVSTSQINLTWTASTASAGVSGYKIYRNGSQVGTSTTNAYSNTGLTANTTYSYTVAAYDTAGNTSVQSAAVSATTQSATVTPPVTPTSTPVAPPVTPPTTPTTTPTTPTTTSAGIGTTITTTARLNVRQSASTSGKLLGTEAKGAKGNLLSGPTVANRYTWWYIGYQNGLTGWSVANYLALATSTVSSTPPSLTPPSTPTSIGVAGYTASSVSLSWGRASPERIPSRATRSIAMDLRWARAQRTRIPIPALRRPLIIVIRSPRTTLRETSPPNQPQ